MDRRKVSFARVQRNLVGRRRANRIAAARRRLSLKSGYDRESAEAPDPRSPDGQEFQLERDYSLSLPTDHS